MPPILTPDANSFLLDKQQWSQAPDNDAILRLQTTSGRLTDNRYRAKHLSGPRLFMASPRLPLALQLLPGPLTIFRKQMTVGVCGAPLVWEVLASITLPLLIGRCLAFISFQGHMAEIEPLPLLIEDPM
ncbi:hypothetical protein J6590_016044 [Homalodisca vitripennis]|nr:hypothetical protein J6590_016044 [Homalodisca vitripennis]